MLNRVFNFFGYYYFVAFDFISVKDSPKSLLLILYLFRLILYLSKKYLWIICLVEEKRNEQGKFLSRDCFNWLFSHVFLIFVWIDVPALQSFLNYVLWQLHYKIIEELRALLNCERKLDCGIWKGIKCCFTCHHVNLKYNTHQWENVSKIISLLVLRISCSLVLIIDILVGQV